MEFRLLPCPPAPDTLINVAAASFRLPPPYQVPDIRGAIEHLTGLGSFLLSGPVPAVAFGMREIAWLMTEADLLVELVQA